MGTTGCFCVGEMVRLPGKFLRWIWASQREGANILYRKVTLEMSLKESRFCLVGGC